MHPLYGVLPGPYARMCQCGLHAALWSYIGLLMSFLAAENRSTAGLIFICQYLRIQWCGTSGFQEHGQCLLIGVTACSLFVSYVFPLSSFIIWVAIVGLGSSN